MFQRFLYAHMYMPARCGVMWSGRVVSALGRFHKGRDSCTGFSDFLGFIARTAVVATRSVDVSICPVVMPQQRRSYGEFAHFRRHLAALVRAGHFSRAACIVRVYAEMSLRPEALQSHTPQEPPSLLKCLRAITQRAAVTISTPSFRSC